jgi:hypothetical protein
MARRQTFKQADVSRALRGAVNAGLSVARAEIDAAGRIVLVFSGPEGTESPASHLQIWKARRGAR